LNDDVFTRLFRELCAGALLDKPSQIIEELANIQEPLLDGAELPYVIRVVQAYRARLQRIPSHAIVKCTSEQLRDAFLRAIFRHEWTMRAPNYVHCRSWDDARELLIQEATDQALNLRPRVQAPETRKPVLGGGAEKAPLGDAVESKSWEQRFVELTRSVDPLTTDYLQPEDRQIGQSWEARFNELSRRIRQARTRMRADLEAGQAQRTGAAGLQQTSARVDSRTRPPDASAPPATPSTPPRHRDPTPDGRSQSKPRFPDGTCYRCGREGHRSAQCTEATDVNGSACVDRPSRSRSSSRGE
jgi:hypothetical protein